MAMAFVLSPPTDVPPPLAARLAAVGRARRVARVWAAAFTLVAVTLAVALAAGVLDAAFHLPAAARAFGLAAVLAAGGGAVVARLRPALRDRATSHRTALLIESGHAGLNDALASAVEFSATPGSGASERFRQVAVKRAENLLARMEPTRVVPSGAAWKAFWLAALVVVVTTALVVANPGRAALAAVRLAVPFGHHPWPAKTVLAITEPTPLPYRMAKGDGLTIRATVSGVVPELAILSLRLADGPVLTEPVPVKREDDSDPAARVSIPLDPSRIPRDFEFRLTANDADTGWLAVSVAMPPRLVPWGERPSPQVSVEPPAYSKLPPSILPDGTGVVEGVAGTRVTFAARADRRVVSARLVPMGDPSGVPVAASFAPLATWTNPLLAPAATPLALTLAEPIPVSVGGADGTELTASFVPRWPGLHALRLTDETGLTGTRLFDFRVYPDPAPAVTLDRPAAGKDPLVLLPSARVTLETRADDRTFGLRRVWLEYRVRDGDDRALPLADYAALTRTFPALAGAAWPAESVSSPAASLTGSLPLARFVKRDRTPPADGDTVTLRTAADDWDDVSVAKAPGRSVEVTIRVVSASTLDAVLQASLAEMRPALRDALEREREAQRLTAEAGKKAEEAKAWTAEAREALARAEQLQRDAKARLADPRDGLRAKAEDARRTAKANGLPPVGTAAQVDAAARTLARLADEHLDMAEAALAAARQSADRAAGNPAEKANASAAVTAAQKQQTAVASGVTGLLERLAQWGGAGEVRADAQTLKDKVAAAGDALRAPPDAAATDGNKLAEEFQKFADDANALLQKAESIAAEKEKRAGAEGVAGEKAKEEARALRDAVEKSGGAQLADDLRTAGAAAKAGRSGEADAARAAASDKLGQMTEALKEKRNEPAGDELKKNRKDDAAALDKLKEEHDELRKKAKAAEAIEDPAERAAELNRLADEQEKLRKEAETLAEKLTRDRAEKTAETVKRAAELMAAAAAEQRKGRTANDERDDAAEKLQDAQKEFKRETKESDEQLEREERDKLLARVNSLRDRQAAAVAEAKRLLAEATKEKRWDRPLLASLADLSAAEAAIAGELRPFADTQLESLPVFAKVAAGAADAGEKAKVRIDERKDDLLTANPGAAFDAETETIAHDRMTKPMTLVLKRLDLLLDAVKTDPKAPGANGEPKPDGGRTDGDGGEAGGPPQGQGSGVPPLAQLKALRGLQADLNERTLEFQKTNPDPAKYDDDLRAELKDLERDQRDIAGLFEKLASQLRPMPEGP
jgi:hypothetical protein